MDISLFFKGFLVGIIISAPIGPVGALCIQRTMSNGRLSGILSGIGAAVGDSIFAVIAVFGLTFISGFLDEKEAWFRIAGGIILLYFGLRVYLSKPQDSSNQDNEVNHFGTFGSALLLTISNPLVILSIIAVFAVLGIVNPTSSYPSTALLILGVFSGAVFLWIITCHILSNYRTRMGQKGVLLINRITGLFILACGGYAFLSLLTI
ncbi:MAG: LysE family translocator [Candidatus Dadabacteria bacterium]|nr:LysE family translocator [Candidatus Dadabacteria bacterium]